ncbi:hypothetical protein [Arthrobacter sp. zg-Y1116]|uniref:hypothetical protein n=1 Tax=Arthrobacter sp. zg-Y1116 TaxID=2964611 RepID=UPI0021021A63|nr:hypothetical protein [Arthrobacter sp. zg-Y1116]MCQ1947615.1 hypothetical protein [Arthrobacter sp. zg-Y1116]
MSQQPGALKGGVRPPRKPPFLPLLFPVMALAGAVYVFVYGNQDKLPSDFPLLGAGLLFGAIVVLLPLRSPWIFLAALIGSCLSFFIVGMPALAWNLGLIVGMLTGIGLQEMRIEMRKNARTGEWFLGYRGFNSVSEIWQAAVTELQAMDGGRKARHSLLIEHGSAHLQISGSITTGLVCHRNPDVDHQDTWAVLIVDQSSSGAGSGFQVTAPQGNSEPVVFVHGLSTAEKALNDFLANPDEIPGPPNWKTGIPKSAVPKVRW